MLNVPQPDETGKAMSVRIYEDYSHEEIEAIVKAAILSNSANLNLIELHERLEAGYKAELTSSHQREGSLQHSPKFTPQIRMEYEEYKLISTTLLHQNQYNVLQVKIRES